MNNDTQLSKYISMILRHKPEAIGITLDSHGWADVHELIKKLNIDMNTLERISSEDGKQRYSFSPDKSRIRANHGHSVNVDVELEECEPHEILYHGTATRFADSITQQGIIPNGRLYVHLSGDYDTAVKVGRRHGKPIVYVVNSGDMFRNGYKFFRSVNGVWLTKHVPAEYLTLKEKS